MGRERGPVHEHGPGDGDDVATEAGRPAGDPHRPRRRISLEFLTGPLSLRGRIALACLLTFVLGYVLARPTIDVFQDLWTSFSEDVPYDGAARTWLIIGFVLLTGLVIWVCRFAAGRALRPIHGMADTVRELGPQNLGQRIRQQGANDELRELADSVDEMLDRVVVGFESQRRFASNASHELRTPLAVQRTLVEVAMVTGDDKEINRLGAQLLMVNERNERLIEGLLVLAESDRGLPGTVPVRLDQLAGEVLDSYSDLAAEHGLTVRRGMVERTVQGDPVLLERLISNLVHNAIKYNESDGWIEIVVAQQPAISVHNSGQVVATESVSSLFEPFRRLTADRTNHRDGAGLGLSIVRSIVAAHHGNVSAKPGQQGGLRVDVALP